MRFPIFLMFHHWGLCGGPLGSDLLPRPHRRALGELACGCVRLGSLGTTGKVMTSLLLACTRGPLVWNDPRVGERSPILSPPTCKMSHTYQTAFFFVKIYCVDPGRPCSETQLTLS